MTLSLTTARRRPASQVSQVSDSTCTCERYSTITVITQRSSDRVTYVLMREHAGTFMHYGV